MGFSLAELFAAGDCPFVGGRVQCTQVQASWESKVWGEGRVMAVEGGLECAPLAGSTPTDKI